MIEYSFADLGQLVGLFVKGGHYTDAQRYLNEMQDRLNTATEKQQEVAPVKKTLLEVSQGTVSEPIQEQDPDELLMETPPLEPKSEPTVVNVFNSVTTDEPEHKGPLRDDQGNVTRISVLIGERGYDPDAHENKELKIFCDGTHIPTAHTADTVEGLVRYHEKNKQGRIKTLELRGKVEIRGLK